MKELDIHDFKARYRAEDLQTLQELVDGLQKHDSESVETGEHFVLRQRDEETKTDRILIMEILSEIEVKHE